MTHDLLMALGRGALAAGLALVLVLAVRVPARRWLGAAFAYRLWLLVPVAAFATLLPAPVRPLIPALQVAPSAPLSSATIELQAAVVQATSFDWQPLLLTLWIIGALALVAVFVHQQRRYLKNLGALSSGDHGALRAQATDGCPALIGALRPRIVVPSDFESRYTPRERELVLVHERTHLARGDAQINAFAALLRCLNWFNPLFHLAASRFRFDQEIACDAAVMSRFPEARRCYADAMLKAQRVGESRQELRLPAGCHWPQSHPLKERIAMLKFPAITGVQRALASAAIVALVSSVGYTSWAAQPASSAVPTATSISDGAAKENVRLNFSVSMDGRKIINYGDSHTSNTRRMEHSGGSDSWLVEVGAGEEFVFDLDAGNGKHLNMSARAVPHADGTISFAATLKRNGSIASQPQLVVRDGVPAAIEVGDRLANGKFNGFRLDLTLQRVTDLAPSENLTYRRTYPPRYPAEAVRNHITGRVVLKVAVDDHGVPSSAEVQSVEPEESAHVLADAAIAAAMQWRYYPGMKDGRPVGGEFLVPVSFTLDDDGASTQPQAAPAGTSVSYRKMRPPVYPQAEIAAKIAGTLYLRARIDANGNVADAYVDQAVPVSALALKETAITALKSWQFNPATQNGRSVESEALVPMRFRIEGEATSEPAASEPAYPDSVRKLEAIVITGAAN